MRKTVIFALAVVLMFAFVTGALASPTPEVGDIIQFGEWDWRVLDVQDGRALIITENAIDRRPYHEHREDISWETSCLREHLNGEFLESFTAIERERIEEISVLNTDNLWYETTGGNDTIDKVFLLSLEEVVKYFGDSGQLQDRPEGRHWIYDEYNSARIVMIVVNDEDDDGEDNEVALWWWLRSPGYYSYRAAFVYADGRINVGGNYVNYYGGGVRPALWLNL